MFKVKKKNNPGLGFLVLGLAVVNLGHLIYLLFFKSCKGKCPKAVELKVKMRKPVEATDESMIPEPELEQEQESPEESENLEKEAEIIGSTSSDKYHKPSCSYAKNITEDNRIYFDSEEDARGQGYKPCGVCH